jgi:glycosyltransferase involved in cell wall biosynthesis
MFKVFLLRILSIFRRSLGLFHLSVIKARSIATRPGFSLRVLLNHLDSVISETHKSFPHNLISFLNQSCDRLLEFATLLGRWATRRRLAKGRPRSLWGVTPILTLPIKARCDRLLGLKSNSIVFTTYHVSSHFDINLTKPTAYITTRAPYLVHIWCKLVLAWALLRYDIFHFFYDRGILIPDNPTEPDQRLMIGINEQELSLLDRADKRLYCYTYGSDVRSRERTLALGPYNCCMDCPEPGRFCICSDAGSRKNIERIRPHAKALLATTDNVNDVDGSRLFHYWALDLDRIAYIGVTRNDGPLVVAHAPNHAAFKGTRFLERAVAQLNEEGVNIELRMVSGVSNEKVLQIFADADVIADQFIAGGYGYTLLEGLARGKPVLCFLRNPKWIAAPEECPVIKTDPEHLVDTLRWCVDFRHELPRLGQRGRLYVEKYYSIPAIAARLGELYLETAGFPKMTEEFLRKGIKNANQTIQVLKSSHSHN